MMSANLGGAMRKAEEAAKPDGGEAQNERSATAFDKRLGERIRARRLEADMSQERLAELLGVTFQQVQKYEKGINRVAAGRLAGIAAALKIPLSQLLEGVAATSQETKGQQNALDAALVVPGAIELVRLYASVEDGAIRRRVLDLVRAVCTAER